MSISSKMYSRSPSPPSCMFERRVKQEDSMSLWAQTQQLQGESMRQVQIIYGVHFPIEVRHFFAQWIEQQRWDQIDETNPSHEQFAHRLLCALIKLTEDKANELNTDDMFVIRMKLMETASQFKEMYGSNPLHLVRVVKKCLATERNLVNQMENPAMSPGGEVKNLGDGDNSRRITIELESMQRMTQQTETDLRHLQHKQEQFIIQYQESIRINSQLTQLQQQPNGQTRIENENQLRQQKQNVEVQLQQKAQELLQGRLLLAEKHKDTVAGLTTLQTQILDKELIDWKRKQQLQGSNATLENGLETLQQWCEALAELIWQNRQQIKKVEFLRVQLPIDIPQGSVDLLPQLNTTITGLLSSLVTSTFIIERQPPQVLKKESRFPATVRLLVGGKLNVHMNPPQVTATIISECQARALLKSDKNLKSDSSGEILNNKGTMEYHTATGQLSVSYRNMQLKKIRRADRKGTEAVTEEKFSILFQSQFNVGGGELVFQVWTLSLPVVVTVHGNQEGNAMATIMWDNHFSEPGRLPFAVPDAVMWPQLAEMLSSKFLQSVGRGLTPQSLDYLAQKLFGVVGDVSGQRVTWAQFNKETMKEKSLTFWEWFYGVLKLTKEHLKDHWVAGTINGFVSKQEAQNMLLSKPDGTFLLRFSDNTPGGITIAWVAPDQQNHGERLVWNLAPYTSKDFSIRSLADRIKDLENLVNLYPDVPKSNAFGKYWTLEEERKQQTDPKGYVLHALKAIAGVQPVTAAPMDFHNPQTPMGLMPQSPQSSYQDNPSVQSQDYGSYGGEGDQADSINPIGFDITDYVPEDIETINVNELLMTYHASQQN